MSSVLKIFFYENTIFFLLSLFFLSFGFFGVSQEEEKEKPDFAVQEDCTQEILEKHCGAANKTQEEKKEEAEEKEEIEETQGFWEGVQNFTMKQMGDPKSCYGGLKLASHCCHDPSDCISGIDTDTMNIMNIFIGAGSKIAASSLSGKGKDISGLCKGMKQFSKAGKNLARASYYRCKAQIHICKRACKIEKKQQCKQYHEEVGSCQQRKNTLPVCNSSNIHVSSSTDCENALNPLKENIKKIAQRVYAIEEEEKPACKDLKQKAKEIKNNMKELAKTVKSSDECNKQATAGIEESTTLEEINKRTASKLRIEEAKNTVTSARKNTGGDSSFSQNEREVTEFNTENPSTSVGGGGQERAASATTSPTNNNNNNLVGAANTLFNKESTDRDSSLKWIRDKNNPTKTRTVGGQKSLHLGETSYDNESPHKTLQNKNIKAKQKIALTGGKFGAYNPPLNKNNPFLTQYQKQKKEESAFNKRNISGFRGGGMHENIFERITRRFQSLCQQQKIDCE